MPDGGTLTLRTRRVETRPEGDNVEPLLQVCIEVSDTGVGMDEETRRRCLEPFFTTKGERGTGLGLAMVYGMVQRHSAGLELESALGEGTTYPPGLSVRGTRLSGPGPPDRCNALAAAAHSADRR